MILGLIQAFLSLAGSLSRLAEARQLISAGEAKAMARSLGKQNDIIGKAIAARRAVKHDLDSVRDDPDIRRD